MGIIWTRKWKLLGGSGGLSKWVNNGDNQGYHMGYRDYKVFRV